MCCITELIADCLLSNLPSQCLQPSVLGASCLDLNVKLKKNLPF